MTQLQYEQLVLHNPDGTLIIDSEGKVLYANPASAELLGRRIEDLAGSNFGHPISTRKGNEVELLRSDGSSAIIEIHSRPLKWQGRDAEVVALRDITARHEAQEQVKAANESLQRTNRALETVSRVNRLLVGRKNEETILKECCKILAESGYDLAWIGYPRRDERRTVEIVASAGTERSYLDGLELTWADEPAGSGPTGSALRTGEAQLSQDHERDPNFAYWRKRSSEHGLRTSLALPLVTGNTDSAVTGQSASVQLDDGRTVIGSLNLYSKQLEAFDDGEVSLLRQLAADLAFGISSRRRNEALQATRAEHQRMREHYQSVVEAITEGIVVVREGKLLFWNPALQRITGLEGSALREITLTELELADEELILPGLLARVDAGERVEKPYVFRMRTAEGNERAVRATGTPIRWDEEQAALIVMTDITVERELEQQLRQAQKMETIGRLVGGVAHDFNNILTAISGYVSLLRSKMEEEDDRRTFVDGIADAADRAGHLTNQLLAYSRRDVIQPRLTDLRSLASETQKMLQRIMGEDISLAVQCDERRCTVHIDPAQAEQILMNLSVNARDAMPGGGTFRLAIERVEVASELDEEVGSGSYVEICAMDTGIGMSPEIQAQIFEPFYSTKERGKGTGLGLATIEGIVERAGGAILVHSEPNRGTTFRIYLPFIAEKEAEPEQSERELGTEGNETVLLVEDDESLRYVVERTLTALGYRVLVTPDGEEAQRTAKEHNASIELIIADVIMPGLSGPETVRKLRGELDGLKVLYISGYTDDKLQSYDISGEDVAFLQKPFSPPQLAQTVRTILDEPSPEETAESIDR